MKKILKYIKSKDIFQCPVELQMSRKGIDDDERCQDTSQGSNIGGVISVICVTLLAIQSFSLLNGMMQGSNDLI